MENYKGAEALGYLFGRFEEKVDFWKERDANFWREATIRLGHMRIKRSMDMEGWSEEEQERYFERFNRLDYESQEKEEREEEEYKGEEALGYLFEEKSCTKKMKEEEAEWKMGARLIELRKIDEGLTLAGWSDSEKEKLMATL